MTLLPDLDLKATPRSSPNTNIPRRRLAGSESLHDVGVMTWKFTSSAIAVHDHSGRRNFSFLRKAEMDNNNPKVQEWESIMWKLQKPLKEARPGEKWLLMELVFKLQP
jgi:hypothetical protein